MPNSTAPSAQAPLTPADFDAATLHEILGQHPDADCSTLTTVFREAKDGVEGSAARALQLLVDICSMRLVPEEPAVIYRPMLELSNGNTSMAPGHLSSTDVDVLAQLACSLRHSALRARLADLVWVQDRQRGPKYPLMAIAAYRTFPLSRDTWHGEGRVSWHRALQLAGQLNSKDDIAAIETFLLDAFFGSVGAEDYTSLDYLKPLRAERRGGGRVREVAEQLATIGKKMFAARRSFEAQAYLEAASDWFDWARESEQQAECLAQAAAAIVLQAEQANGAIVQHQWLSKAIEAYRRVPGRFREKLGVEAAINEIRRRRETAAQAMLGEMVAIQGPRIDVSDLVQSAIDHVKDRPPLDALLAFCGLDSPPDVDQLKAEAVASLQAAPLSSMIEGFVVASDGRQVENVGPSQGWEEQVAGRARAIFRDHAAKIALAILMPARDQLRMEHAYRLGDFIAVAERSPVVPSDRARIVGQGLHAGWYGDMVQAMHVLMPQFEHIVRQILRGAGGFTSQHGKDSLDMEVALASLLARQQMIEEFGAGLTLAIHALMCDRGGSNLRNDVAHGLADEEMCDSAFGLYAWWLILQLVTETFAAASEVEHGPSADATQGASGN